MLVQRSAEAGAAVTWSRYDEAERRFEPRAATFRLGGGWAWADPASVPAAALWTIPEPGQGLAVGTDPAGNAVATWRLGGAVRVAGRPAGGSCGTPVTLAPSSGEGPAELVALGAGGHAVALWTVRTPEAGSPLLAVRRTVWAADRQPDGTWSAPYVLAGPDAAHSTLLCGGCPDVDKRPAVAVDASGNAVAAWPSHRAEPAGTAILWAQRPAGGAWSEPAVLSEAAGPDVALAVNAAGSVIATWSEHSWLHSAERPAGGAFGAVAHLGPVQSYASGLSRGPLSLTIDGQGSALAVWVAGQRTILAALRSSSGAWSEPVDVAAPGDPPKPWGDPIPPLPKAPLLGAMTLSRHTVAAPACARAARPRARRACRAGGTVLGFRLRAADEVRVTIQRRGKGRALRSVRIAAGAGEHRMRLLTSRPLPPGRYTIRIRATAEGWAPPNAARTLLVVAPR